jgi:hypothetical protein
VSLIEKAYAKLNIRYINLTSGFIDEALQDLTGFAPEMTRFSPSIDVDDLWDSLKMYVYTGSLIGGSLNFLGRKDYQEDEKREIQREAKMSGIQYGHAYGILDVREVNYEGNVVKLLRIKNPWGKDNNLEWNGEWGDQDKRWTSEMKKKYNDAGLQIPSKLDKDELEHKFGKNDNIFIMQISDFAKYFNTLMIVRDFPDEWSGIRYFTRWNPGFGLPPRSVNWAKNPVFSFELKKTTEMSIRLQQPDPRCFADARPPMRKLVLMFLVMKQTESSLKNFSNSNVVMQSNAADSRSVSSDKELPAGRYLISIFTVNEGTVSDCYLSVYFNCKKNEIVFQDSSWEVILEEEEEDLQKPKTRPKGPLKAKVKAKDEEKKNVKDEEKEDEDIVIETNETVDELEVVIKDPAALELETEVTMCNLLGVNFQDYKDFQGMSISKQTELSSLQTLPPGILDFNDYCLGSRGVSVLISTITSYKDLRVLGLSNNQLTDHVLVELSGRLCRLKNLEEINVSNNPELTDRSAAALLYLAGRVKTLKKIDVSRTSVSLDLAHQILARLNRRGS